jgi:hypothetical protein
MRKSTAATLRPSEALQSQPLFCCVCNEKKMSVAPLSSSSSAAAAAAAACCLAPAQLQCNASGAGTAFPTRFTSFLPLQPQIVRPSVQASVAVFHTCLCPPLARASPTSSHPSFFSCRPVSSLPMAELLPPPPSSLPPAPADDLEEFPCLSSSSQADATALQLQVAHPPPPLPLPLPRHVFV